MKSFIVKKGSRVEILRPSGWEDEDVELLHQYSTQKELYFSEDQFVAMRRYRAREFDGHETSVTFEFDRMFLLRVDSLGDVVIIDSSVTKASQTYIDRLIEKSTILNVVTPDPLDGYTSVDEIRHQLQN